MGSEERQAMAAREVLFRLPGMETVAVERDLPYATHDGETLAFDLYRPSGGQRRAPVMVLVGGFPGAGVRRVFGCSFKEMGAVTSWCRLLAACGIAAVASENRRPVEDLRALVAFLRRESAALDLDASRLGLWASSGNAPAALGALAESAAGERIACAVLAYPYTLDLDGATAVAEAAKAWGFVEGAAGRSVDDLPATTPVLVVRAGRDAFRGLNAALDAFVLAAWRRDLPVACVNHATATHAFDLERDDPETAAVMRQILAFAAVHLGGRLAALAAE